VLAKIAGHMAAAVRIIDLSRAAARELDMIRVGTTRG
jgi:rare lipoprotein A (peptidoglycan hydrolase)